MLHQQPHHHFAHEFSPCAQERRLAYRQGRQGKKRDDRGQSPESHGETGPETAKRAVEPERKDDVTGMTSDRRQRILRHVPTALLDQYTLGAAYLTDTLVGILGEDQLKRLLKQHPELGAVNLRETADLDAVLARAFATEGNRSSALLSTLDTRTAGLMTQMLEAKIRQYDELKNVAMRHVQQDERLTHAVDAQDQKLSLTSRTMDDWLRTSSTQEICTALGIPPVAESAREQLLGKVRGYLDVKRRLANWNLPEIERNEHLRAMLKRTGNLGETQKALYEQLQKSLPVVASVLDAQLTDEAEKTSAWLEEEKRRYAPDMQGITADTHDKREAGFQKKHGVSALAVAREVEESEAAIALARQGDVIDPQDPGSVINAAAMMEKLARLRSAPDGTPRSIVDRLRPEQEAAEAWAQGIRGELETVMQQYADPRKREQIAQCFGIPTFFDTIDALHADLQISDRNPRGIVATEYPQSRRRALGRMVQSLRSVRLMQAMTAHAEDVEAQTTLTNADQTILDIVGETRGRLHAAVADILATPEIAQGISGLLNVRKHVESRAETLEQELRQAERERVSARGLGYVRAETSKLERAAILLGNMRQTKHYVLSEQDFERRTGTRSLAAYDYATGDILVNRDRCAREKAWVPDLVRHEREHAVQDILTRRAGVFPFLHRAAFEVLQESNTAFTDVLRRHAQEWGIAHQREKIRAQARDAEEAQALEDELLTEELLNRYIDWKQKPENERTAAERELMSMVESAGLADKLQGIAERSHDTITRADAGDLQLFQTATAAVAAEQTNAGAPGIVPTQGAAGEEASEGENVGPVDVKGQFNSCETLMGKIYGFMKAYPAYSATIAPMMSEHEKVLQYLKDIFESQTVNGRPYPHPETQPTFRNALTQLHDSLTSLKKETQGIDNKMHDLTNAQGGKITGWQAFWGNIAFMSPLDIYLLMQDSIEDVKRMWNRRSKQMRSKVAQGLFGNIPENDLPGLRYLGRLAKENEKREQQSEDEEVDVWKEGLKNKDAYQLMDILNTIQTNKDQAKAIFFLLADKGRIDWGDVRIWNLLNRLSQFEMPIAQCKRDIVLRNNWLNKMVKDIWDDSDQFLDWKTSNDSNYNTNRDKFNEYVDTLSQNSGAMRAELERILSTYVSCRDSGVNPPQDVNPHLYEKIVEFAMVKGKMSMEDKFYFLIRGIAEGLLPLERLNILNNQVLGTFPFIDYFAGQNNTMPEIKALSARITESGNQFRPGMKTTIFLETELARDESTRQRVTKVITRSGEQIDHEDAPMLMAFLDYGGVEEMLQAFSGQRQRMTKEGLKNSYVGFNTLFKSYARVAQLENEGITRLTQKDAVQLGRSLLSYIHFDNIALQAANDGKNRQFLSWENVENETMPSGDGRTPAEFRDRMNKLAVAIFRAYGLDRAVVGRKTVKDANGQDRQQDIVVTADQYLGFLRGKSIPGSKEEKQQLFDATQQFQHLLLQRIQGNPNVLKAVLQSVSDNDDDLLQEGESITRDAVRKAVLARRSRMDWASADTD